MTIVCYLCRKRINIDAIGFHPYIAFHEYRGDVRFAHSQCHRDEIARQLATEDAAEKRPPSQGKGQPPSMHP